MKAKFSFLNLQVDWNIVLVLNGDIEPCNLLIEIAHWLGIVFAMGLIYSIVEMALRHSVEDVSVRRALHRPNPVAVHGDGAFAEALEKKNMGASAVHSDLPVSFKAPTQVLLFSSDGAAMDFFSKNNSNLLKSEEVYICLNSMRADAVNTNNVFVFSMADICAQLYWEEHPVLSAQKISVVGSGSCAESILTQGLLVNLYDFEGGVEYLVVGDFAEYLSLHRSLDDAFLTNKDILKITFEPWYDCVNELADYERIILCDLPDENLKVASALRNGMVKTPIDLRADSGSCLNLMGERSDIEVFGTTDQLCTRAIVL